MEIISNIIQKENCPPIKYPMVDFKKELKYNISFIHKTVSSIDLTYLSKLEKITTGYISSKNDLDMRNEDIIDSLDSQYRQDMYSLDSNKDSKIYQMDSDLKREIKNMG